MRFSFPRLPETLESRTLFAAAVSGFTESVVVNTLTSPTAMHIAPDGRFFITEQDGDLRIVKDGSLLPTPAVHLDVDSSGERGLLGVTLDPDFTTNGFIYLYRTVTTPAVHNRVSRFTVTGDSVSAASEMPLLDLPDLGPSNHNGGALHFGGDGKLYIGVGENGNPSNSQSLDTPLGKMLRINPDGSIPSDNPFFGQTTGINRAIWAMGLRNPYTFAVQPGQGRIFINDVGQSSFEEVDVGGAGANYGWPDAEGPSNDPRFRSPLFSYTPAAGAPFGATGSAITGGAFYNPATRQFPAEYEGAYFFSDVRHGYVKALQLDYTSTEPPDPNTGADVNVLRTVTFATNVGFPVDLSVDPQGNLYCLTYSSGSTGRLLRYSVQGAPVPGETVDLTAALVGDVPTQAVGGTKARTTVRVTNAGTGRAVGQATVRLFASADATIDDGDTELASLTRNLRLKPGGGRNFKLPFNFPEGAAGETQPAAQNLLARVEAGKGISDADAGNNATGALGPIQVAPAYVDLGVAFPPEFPPPSGAAAGDVVQVRVAVSNTGSVATTGPVVLRLVGSPDNTVEATEVPLATRTLRARLKPQTTRILRLRFRVPTGLGPAALVAVVNAPDGPAEPDEANNVTSAAGAFAGG